MLLERCQLRSDVFLFRSLEVTVSDQAEHLRALDEFHELFYGSQCNHLLKRKTVVCCLGNDNYSVNFIVCSQGLENLLSEFLKRQIWIPEAWHIDESDDLICSIIKCSILCHFHFHSHATYAFIS